jgi:hypothetical protein
MLKKIGAANWTDEYIFDPTQKFTKETASVNLQGCWNEVSQNHVKAAWAAVLQNGEKYLEKASIEYPIAHDSEDESSSSESSEFVE